MTLKLLRVAAVAVASLIPAAGFAATIDFDSISVGTLFGNGDTFTEDGFTFEVNFVDLPGGGNQGVAGVTVFDTTCVGNAACNGDTDLTPNGGQGADGVEGNVLILQELGGALPDDAATAGEITLTLVSGPDFYFLGASAIDDTTFTFSTSVDAGALGVIDIPNNGGTGAITFATPSSLLTVGDSIILNYGGSGAVDSLVLAAVPLPAGGVLLLTAFGGFAGLRRMRRKS